MAVTQANYISYMVSPYNSVFRELGYPELDIIEYPDGEWSMIQYFKSPVIPCLTPWGYVLTKMRNVEKTAQVFRKWTDQLDLEKRFIWAEQDQKERELEEQARRDDEHQIEFSDKAFKIIRKNDGLMQRIAKNGLHEMSLRSISRHIPNYRFRGDKKRCM